MSTADLTVQQLLQQGMAALKAAAIDPNDARSLLAHCLDLTRDRLILIAGDPVDQAVAEQFRNMIAQRLAHRPVSKIIGQRQFWGRTFVVTDDVLDPRSETETLIAAVLAGNAPHKMLDLGTGTGCIPLTLLAEIPQLQAVACDISDRALAVARRNAQALGQSLGLMDRLQLLQSDWFSAIEGQFDLITSNPPYISDQEMADLSREVHDHDPHLALTPGGDGLSPYGILARGAMQHLTPGGRILVEIGWKQGADVTAIFTDAGLRDVRILPDMDGRDRIVSAYKPAD